MDMSDHPGLRHNEPMSRHVSWRAGGSARRFYQPADVADLCAFLRTLPANEAILFVGLGSNLLVRDGGFDGTVIFTHHALTGIAAGDAPRGASPGLEFDAGAGVPSPHLARFAPGHSRTLAYWRSAAVDPRLIAFGSRIFVPAYCTTPARGWLVARDTGGAIIGPHIDVYRRPPAQRPPGVHWGTLLRGQKVFVVPPGTTPKHMPRC